MTITRQIKLVFDTHKTLDTFYFTSDQQAFFTEKEATVHAGNLANKTVTAITRAEVAAWWPGEVTNTLNAATAALDEANAELTTAKTELSKTPTLRPGARISKTISTGRKAALQQVNQATVNVRKAQNALRLAQADSQTIADLAKLKADKEKLVADSQAKEPDAAVVNADAQAVKADEERVQADGE